MYVDNAEIASSSQEKGIRRIFLSEKTGNLSFV
jgi:hypothetical protein